MRKLIFLSLAILASNSNLFAQEADPKAMVPTETTATPSQTASDTGSSGNVQPHAGDDGSGISENAKNTGEGKAGSSPSSVSR